ncbi:MAG: phosphoglucomutase 2-like 1, isoform CRA_b [Olpidium bornovanus]|uniref:Phosphoglucomutase 2-like 1, isoform CRA_b n=1 Tax=Olpidium bornovanus TaxID=278681 RepID=A0A8H8DJS7_9FUNG|nr:MAG: phosphoglucomutase 2-like 1, isoform CRA_b [Olpidium bornovanus]
MIDRYFGEVKALCHHEPDNASTSLKFVYTAMHGVGAPFAQKAFASFGFKEFLIVKEQVDPDPDFPTVAFPNPEEGKGALALAVATAEREGASLIFANDPDADRLAVAEKQREQVEALHRYISGKWTIFSGNQIGVMLASYIWKNWKASNGDGGQCDPDFRRKHKVAMLASAVSSKMLERMAQVEGFHFVETLTGFKWLGNRAMDLEEKGMKVLFAYEEAIGFMVGDVVRDKDGISSVACFAEFATQLHKKGQLVGECLDEMYDRYGYFVSNNSYFICHHKPTIDRVFNKIRFGENPVRIFGYGLVPSQDPRYPHALQYPTRVGGVPVTYICDLTIGYDSQRPDKTPLLPTSASSHMISFRLENGCYFTLRTRFVNG